MAKQAKTKKGSKKRSKPKEVIHLMVLDRSGSMAPVRRETVAGFNEQLKTVRTESKKHKKLKQRACLVMFNHVVESDPERWLVDIGDIEDLDEKSYVPEGSTALYDAVGDSIKRLLKEADDKATVLVTIFTDGLENSSRSFDIRATHVLIDEAKGKGWTVTLIGCDEMTLDGALRMGIPQGNILRAQRGKEGTQAAFATMSTSRCSYLASVAAGRTVSQDDFYQK